MGQEACKPPTGPGGSYDRPQVPAQCHKLKGRQNQVPPNSQWDCGTVRQGGHCPAGMGGKGWGLSLIPTCLQEPRQETECPKDAPRAQEGKIFNLQLVNQGACLQRGSEKASKRGTQPPVSHGEGACPRHQSPINRVGKPAALARHPVPKHKAFSAMQGEGPLSCTHDSSPSTATSSCWRGLESKAAM